MNPQTTSILAVLLVILAAAAVFIMLEITGRTGERGNIKRWIHIHKILGFLFILLFAVLFFVMIGKTAGVQEELTSRAMIHISLALALVVLITIKVLMARRYPRHSSKMPSLGIIILTFSFVLTGISAGYYVLHRSDLTYTTLTDLDKNTLNLELGKSITHNKCNKCHTLERVYRSFKTDERWTETVNRMALLDAPNITGFDVKQVLNYLIQQQKTREDQEFQSVRRQE